jgi:hypothetical protein
MPNRFAQRAHPRAAEKTENSRRFREASRWGILAVAGLNLREFSGQPDRCSAVGIFGGGVCPREDVPQIQGDHRLNSPSAGLPESAGVFPTTTSP